MAKLSLRDSPDPDERRKEILWTAISFIVIFASWLAVVLVFGYQPLILGMTYDEAVLVVGLALLVLCSILYLVGREREQRYTNKRLLQALQATVASLDQRVGQLNNLCATSAELAGSLDIDSISQCAVDSLVKSGVADSAWLILYDQRTGRRAYVRHSGGAGLPDMEDHLEPDGVSPAPLSEADRLASVEARVQAWNQVPHLMATHVRLKEGLAGVLVAHRGEEEAPFTPDDLNMLTTLANMAAKAAESAQLHAELRENYLATVRSLVRSLDARDNYAATHSQRVAALAVRMAEHMGLPEETIRDVEVFAPLHDVGKIGIQDSILLKAGALSEEEKAVCRQHCLIGERIIRPLKPSRQALALVRNHHECWDGRGYPDALAGEAIPIAARILKVADCYDALISDRPYGAVMNGEEALGHFRLNAGVHYDPAVVEALHQVLREEGPSRLPLAPARPEAETAPSERLSVPAVT